MKKNSGFVLCFSVLIILFGAVLPVSDAEEASNCGRAPWLPLRASIESVRANVSIDHSFTTTVIEQVLYNPFNRPVGDTFMFKVPDDAFITNFSVEVDGEVHFADLMTKDQAEENYEDAVAKGHSAGLMLSRDSTKFPYRE